MQVHSISSINFESKYHISADAIEDANALLYMMKKNTVHKKNPKTSGWSTELLSSLKMGKVKFTNAALFVPPTANPELSKNIPDCILQVGKNLLNINSKTGEVISYKIGVFTSLKCFISKADKYIRELLNNFNNTDVVKKTTFETGGYIKLI